MGARVKEEALGAGLSESLESRSKYLSLSRLHFLHVQNGLMTWTLAVHPTPRGSPWVWVALVRGVEKRRGQVGIGMVISKQCKVSRQRERGFRAVGKGKKELIA